MRREMALTSLVEYLSMVYLQYYNKGKTFNVLQGLREERNIFEKLHYEQSPLFSGRETRAREDHHPCVETRGSPTRACVLLLYNISNHYNSKSNILKYCRLNTTKVDAKQ